MSCSVAVNSSPSQLKPQLPISCINNSYLATSCSVCTSFMMDAGPLMSMRAMPSSFTRSCVSEKACESISSAAKRSRHAGSSKVPSSSYRYGRATASASCEGAAPSLNLDMAARSCCNSFFATVQPVLSWLTNWRAGTRTSSKNTSQKLDLPLISSIGLTVTPGLFISIKIKLMPSCFFTVVSVRTRAYIQSA